MTQISLVIFDDAEAWIRENVPLMEVDSVSCVVRNGRFQPDGDTPYYDRDEGKQVIRVMGDHVNALKLLCEQVGRTLFVGGIKSPFDLLDAGNWDVEVVDAYWQLVMYGEVIYG